MHLNKFLTAIIPKTIYFITCMQKFDRTQHDKYAMFEHFQSNNYFGFGGKQPPWHLKESKGELTRCTITFVIIDYFLVVKRPLLGIQDFESDSSSKEDPPDITSDSTTTECDWVVSE